eukprot:EG_transcript_2137
MIGWVHRHAPNGTAILLTENGFCGSVAYQNSDGLRYYQRHLRAVWESVVLDRIPVLGYTAWSYADNYEWGTYEPPTPSLMLSWLSGGSGGTGFLASPSKNYFPGGKLVRTPPPARMVRRNTSAVWTPGIYGKALRYRARWLGGSSQGRRW